MIFGEVESILGALILGSALLVQIRSYIRPMISTVVTQSLLLAAMAILIGVELKSYDLIILAFLIVLLRGVLINYVLQKRLPRGRMYVREYSHGVPSVVIASVIVLILSFLIYRIAFFPYVQDNLGAIGISVIFQGLLLIMTRRNSFAHFVGYVEEENGVIFLALTIIPLPLLIEISVLLDVLALIIAGGILVTNEVEHTRVEELMG